MRLSARAVMGAESRLNERNREVLLEQGREAVERVIEREFDRVDATVRRDLSEYPALHRKLSEEITVIDDDYKEGIKITGCHDCKHEKIEHYDVKTGKPIKNGKN